jgi:hypothetical protein
VATFLLEDIMKRIAIGLVLACVSGSAWGQCASLPYTLTNGTIANADQVMADLNCLALIGGTTFTGRIGIGAANDGSALVQARTDQNAPTVGFKVTNAAAGGSSQARVDFSTYTPNSYAIIGLMENSGSPYWQVTAGPGVTAGYIDLPSHIFRTPAGVERMRIAASGNVGIGTSSPSYLLYVNGSAGGTQGWNQASDGRLKTNIKPVTGGLALIERLNPVHYDWRKPEDRSVGQNLKLPVGERQIGFIAQEVEEVIPEAVTAPARDGAEIYSLKQESLIPVLVAAIKELRAEVRAQRDQIEALKAKQ